MLSFQSVDYTSEEGLIKLKAVMVTQHLEMKTETVLVDIGKVKDQVRFDLNFTLVKKARDT